MKPIGQSVSGATESPQRLTASLNGSAERLTEAAINAKLLFGCYRAGDASDPEIYVGAVIAVLSRFPSHIMREVCDPVEGLPGKTKWLPTVAEVLEACQIAYGPELRAVEREEGIRQQLSERQEISAPVRAVTTGRIVSYREVEKMEIRPTGVFELGRAISYRG